MMLTENFDLREFVSPTVWNRFGEDSIWFVNPWCYEFAQFVKDWLTGEYGEEVTVTVNNWHFGGNRKWSCHRSYKYINEQIKAGKKTATLSQHVGGQAHAIDFQAKIKSSGEVIPSSDIRAKMMKQESLMMAHGLTTLEGDKYAPVWVHADNRRTPLDHILIVGA